jgi:hypothetical protein
MGFTANAIPLFEMQERGLIPLQDDFPEMDVRGEASFILLKTISSQ